MDQYVLFTVAHEIGYQVSNKIKSAVELGIYTGEIGKGGDRVKIGDQIAEEELQAIIPPILEKYYLPGATIISEEKGHYQIGEGSVKDAVFMLIDPVDGSNNMRPRATPQPFLGFSIAMGSMSDLLVMPSWDAIQVGIVRDLFHQTVYSAMRGRGTHLAGRPLATSPNTDMNEAIIGASLDKMGERLQEIFDKGVVDLLKETKCQRRLGATSLDMCQVASGDYDAFVSVSGHVQMHDVAAAKLIVEEAGGIVELFQEKKNITHEPLLRRLYEEGNAAMKDIRFEIVASGNVTMHRQIKEILKIEE